MTLGRPAAGTFRDLIVWQKAHKYPLATYAILTPGFWLLTPSL